jgi:hypothetical protein
MQTKKLATVLIDLSTQRLTSFLHIKQYPDILRGRIKKIFQDRAQGMFLCIGIAAQQLREHKQQKLKRL